MKKAECKWGHKDTTENTYVRPNGVRTCKECRKNYKRKAYRIKNGGVVGDDRHKYCVKCGSKGIFDLYRPWLIKYDDLWAPCFDEFEKTPCPQGEHLHRICQCGYWWWIRCADWSS